MARASPAPGSMSSMCCRACGSDVCGARGSTAPSSPRGSGRRFLIMCCASGLIPVTRTPGCVQSVDQRPETSRRARSLRESAATTCTIRE